jgi:hypothetical protein
MKLSEKAREDIKEIVMKDYLHNPEKHGKNEVMTMREMEMLVSEIGNEITDPIMGFVIQSEKTKISTQKKTVRTVRPA